MDTIIFIVLILLSALFASSETALFSLRESQVRMIQKNKDGASYIIAKLKGDPHRLLATLLFGNTVVNITIGSLATISAIEYADSIGVGLATGFATIAVLLFGEIFPKSFAITYNRQVARVIAYPIFFCYLIFYPIASIFVYIEKWVKKATKSPNHSAVTEEEIRIMSDIGLEHGEIDRAERQMIENIFNFDDTLVGRIMTPKDSIDSLSGDVPVSQIAYYVSQSGFSRFPVYDGHSNNYIGYVHTNDVMRVLNSDKRDHILAEFISPLRKVSEKLNIEETFRSMTRERSHMYLVHREGAFDEVIGLVTMEDILEEIMGEIEDEGDKREILTRRGK